MCIILSMTEIYQDAIETARRELTEAEEQRNVLDIRILRLKQTVATLMRLVGQDVPDSLTNKGITDAVREYLTFAKAHNAGPVTIRELRSQLEIVGYDFTNYKNPNASLAGTLERLVEGREVRKVRKRRDDGVTVTGYLWLGAVDYPASPDAVEDEPAKEDEQRRDG